MDSRRAIFLDRDGVINVNRSPYVMAWQEFVFETDALTALAQLAQTDFLLVVVSNQSGIGRGQMTRAAVEEIHARMRRAIADAGGRLDRIYYCPHAPTDGCECRKPAPGMLLRGSAELNIDLARSFFVGDWIDDVRAARRAGVTPLLVQTGRGAHALQEIQHAQLAPPAIFDNLMRAAEWLLGQAHSSQTNKKRDS
ncbi:MAG: D-glycero-beta-D-manno-heptose-1,7-bisphosphate 7-phosphatase [Chloroflexi bacterium UTCFX4]|jgi:histidinol-phosphate phosphatase family protein|nr:MAG: D-glycero-beta-D-manno-heptose-1,7-bisphosphate 7-phosphatase [Chloroflexi bacterium UTCFX4]